MLAFSSVRHTFKVRPACVRMAHGASRQLAAGLIAGSGRLFLRLFLLIVGPDQPCLRKELADDRCQSCSQSTDASTTPHHTTPCHATCASSGAVHTWSNPVAGVDDVLSNLILN